MAWDGKKLTEAREAKGLNQDDLAGLLGIEAASVSRWENNVNAPRAKRIPQLSEILGKPPEYFKKSKHGDALDERVRVLEASLQKYEEALQAPPEITQEKGRDAKSELVRIFGLLSEKGQDIVLEFAGSTLKAHPAPTIPAKRIK